MTKTVENQIIDAEERLSFTRVWEISSGGTAVAQSAIADVLVREYGVLFSGFEKALPPG